VYAWSANDSAGKFESVCALTGPFKRGVCQLAFSQDSSRLLAVGMDYTVAVFDTCQKNSATLGKMVASSLGPKDKKILHCSLYGVNGEYFLSCGEKHVWLWKLTGSALTSEDLKLGSHKSKTFLCAVSLTGEYGAVSSSDGDILILQGNAVSATYIKVHDKSVNALWANKAGDLIISGDAEGKIIIWSHSKGVLTRISDLSMTGHSCPSGGKLPPIRALCLSSDGKKLLVGTQMGEIIEMEALVESSRGRALVSGHYKDEVWGLDVCAGRKEFCTVGDDGYLRIFSADQRRQLRCTDLGSPARCCAYSPDGTSIAVGFSLGLSKGLNPKVGSFSVYTYQKKAGTVFEELKLSFELKDSKRDITDIKYSSDGKLLGVASADNNICVYVVMEDFKKKAKFNKHNAKVSHFDFSYDGKYIQSNCSAYELLYSETGTGNQITTGVATLLDTEWASYTCTLGYATLGIWSIGMDGTDVNAVARSPGGSLLASGDDFSKVKLFSFPCVVEESPCNTYSGHSSHVTNVRWMKSSSSSLDDGAYLISTGGGDKSIFVWRCVPSDGTQIVANVALMPEPTFGGEDTDDAILPPSGGDEFAAIKPWLGAIVAPSAYSPAPPDVDKLKELEIAGRDFASRHKELRIGSPGDVASKYSAVKTAAAKMRAISATACVTDPSSPETTDEFELEWVHGYRGYDARSNIQYIDQTLLAYPAASLVILLDTASKTQRYFRGHTDDVMALAWGTESQLIASAQIGKEGRILVWEHGSFKIRATLTTKQKNIQQIAFINDFKLIVSIAQDNSVVTIDWNNSRILANVKGEPSLTYALIASSNTKDAINFISVGDKHIKWWSLSGTSLTSNKVGITGVPGTSLQVFLSVVEVKGRFLVGCADGQVYIIIDKVVKGMFKGYSDQQTLKTSGKTETVGVTTMYMHRHLNLLICGTTSGMVSIFDTSLLHSAKDSPSLLTSFSPIGLLGSPTAKAIQSVACVEMSNDIIKIAVGTRGCDILQIAYSNVPSFSCTLKDIDILIQSHCADELWGLTTHPSLPVFCTSGDDRTLRLWDVHNKTQIGFIPLGGFSRACAYDPSGSFIAVGYGGKIGQNSGKTVKEGVVRIYCLGDSSIAVELIDPKKTIGDLKFSPDGSVLAVASHDTNIYVYSVAYSMGTCSAKLRCKFGKHNAAVAHLDFSADGKYLQSNCNAYELLFSEVGTGKHLVSAKELRDVQWDSFTCILGWPIQGIWEPLMDGSDINAVDRSHAGNLVAFGDDFSKVQVHRYPTLSPDTSTKITLNGHSSHVTAVKWTVGDECLISTGGDDKCIFQWRHSIVGNSFAAAAHTDDSETEDGETDEIKVGDPTGGDESGAVKPWLGAIRYLWLICFQYTL
jgi:WD40 repeat protein